MLIRYRDVFRSFHSHGVRYLVIGGVAAIAHGLPRGTFDLDILIATDEDNVNRLLQALTDAGMGTAALTDAASILAHEITILRDRVHLDVQTRTPGLDFEDAWARRQLFPMGDITVPVLSRADLIRAKRASGRPVDLDDVRALEALSDHEASC